MLKVDNHGCDDPRECSHCQRILYDLSTEAMRLGLIPIPEAIKKVGLENLPKEFPQ